MSGSLLKFEKRYSVKIGGLKYPVVKIGNQLWINKNLENEIGTLNTDYRIYDKSVYGLIYIVNSALHGSVKTFLDNVANETGFHLPSNSDLNELKTYSQSQGWSIPQCWKTIGGWNNNNGTDNSGLSLLGSGDYNGSTIEHIRQYFHGMKKDGGQYYVSDGTAYDLNPGYLPTNYGVAIRLVKEVS